MALPQLLSELSRQPRMDRPQRERPPGQDASRSPRSPPLATSVARTSGAWPAPLRDAGFLLSFRLFRLSTLYPRSPMATTTTSSNLVPPSPPPRKETAAQHVERVKRERPSWSILDDIRRYAREGFDSIPADDLAVRLRAWGLYTQGDGAGVRGEAIRHFMMRLRTPNGVLTSAMCRTIADLSDRYARGSLDITNRQNFQLHWLRIEDIPAGWEGLDAVGWTSMGACGDDTRTVTGCPLAGVDADEVIDASSVAIAVDRHLNGHDAYANLPRKFKISISGCAHWC